MIDINLLPPGQKQKQLAVGTVAYLTIGFIVLLFTFGGFTLTLFTIRLTVIEKIGNNESRLVTLNRQMVPFQKLEQDVLQVNKDLAQSNNILKQQTHPTLILDKISNHLGSNITLTTLSVSKPDTTAVASTTKVSNVTGTGASTNTILVSIAGNTKSRSDMIDFKRALDADSSFSNIIYAISSAANTNQAATPGSTPATLTFTLTANYSAGGAL